MPYNRSLADAIQIIVTMIYKNVYLNLQSKIWQRDSRSQGKAKQNFMASEDSYTTGHLTNVRGNENALCTPWTLQKSVPILSQRSFVQKKLVITKIAVVFPFPI